jgi:hypothetical protein
VQTKLQVGAAHDRFEQEADSVAERLHAATAPDVTPAPLRVQRASESSEGQREAPASIEATVSAAGRPLPNREFFEARLGHDFSRVRVHDDGAAARSAADVDARAYTVGEHVVFGQGQLQPGNAASERLVAHELTHVLQQRSAPQVVQRSANAGGGSGSRLPDDVRATMERRLGSDFSSVTVHHSGAKARQVASSGAYAITRGDEIHFAPGRFNPNSAKGMGLIAHELAHVVQQRRGAAGSMSAQPALESEAERVERDVSASVATAPVSGRSRYPEHRKDSFDLLKVIRAAAGGSIAAVCDVVVSLAGDDPVVRKIDALRKEIVAKGASIILPASVVRTMESMYQGLKAHMPSWLPLPEIRFYPDGQPAAPLIIIGGIAITVEALILFLAFLLVAYWLLTNLDPATAKARRRAVEDIVDRIGELVKPRPIPYAPSDDAPPKPKESDKPRETDKPKDADKPKPVDPKPADPKVEPKTEPKTDPKGQPKADPKGGPKTGPRRPTPAIDLYPICWSPKLPDPQQRIFHRAMKEERDQFEAGRARMMADWRAFRDPDFDASKYHVHHVVPLYLGGDDNLRTNGVLWPARVHLRGHADLNFQPLVMAHPRPLSPYLTKHPVGTKYVKIGVKGEGLCAAVDPDKDT